ncbi:hypothetical protein BTN50_0712 [Candidatus Enterovibrio altilux]|uniref:Mobile element protein n=1 Tax=Candidatus Enterovibrio altilux TaxID=1927128 RepID=A0A291B890_9GAMM|nr:hypothetical protein BTN50_0712 [Candidatus Enterovibrio luxaltus]
MSKLGSIIPSVMCDALNSAAMISCEFISTARRNLCQIQR